MFYWHFESRADATKDPLVFWLTGGPGCSSITALFAENGPYKIRDDLNLTKNANSWNEHSNIVFVDQPVGTGYSKAGFDEFVTDEKGVAADFFEFLQGFYTKFPQYNGREMFVTGESYAGHYIPAIAAKIVTEKDSRMNLVGVAIGNGLVDPYNQYPEYATFAYENNLIGKFQYYILKGAFYACQQLIRLNAPFLVTMEECQLGVQTILGNPLKPRFNVYDIREKCGHPPLCYDFSNIDKFVQRKDVIELLGVQGRSWTECKQDVHLALLTDWMLNLSPQITLLLDNKVNVLVYSGDKDFICNWRGGEKWTNEVDWAKKTEFQNTPYKKWFDYGEVKSVDNLHFLRVYNAGHMVPMDQPEASLKMLTNLFQGWIVQRKHLQDEQQ